MGEFIPLSGPQSAQLYKGKAPSSSDVIEFYDSHVRLRSPSSPTSLQGQHMVLGSQGGQPAHITAHPPHPTKSCPRVPLPLTLQLLSSSADRMMVPHFFPGTPLGEEKMEEWRVRQRQRQEPAHSRAQALLILPSPHHPADRSRDLVLRMFLLELGNISHLNQVTHKTLFWEHKHTICNTFLYVCSSSVDIRVATCNLLIPLSQLLS